MAINHENVTSLIFYIRGEKVMLDFHLASLYEVETKHVKQAVTRNKDSFPSDFVFKLTKKEVANLRSQNVISSEGRGGTRYMPFAFTEQGVSMLATVLKSKRAVEVKIAIMRAFVFMRRMLENNKELRKKIEQLEAKYDKQFAIVFEAIKQLMDPPTVSRNPIGFRLSNVKPEGDLKAVHIAARRARPIKSNTLTKKNDRVKKKRK
jgi:phage regulator Rha-like protein